MSADPIYVLSEIGRPIGTLYIQATDAEISAGVTPTNYQFEPGDVRRYGATLDGSTDDSSALSSAITMANSTGAFVLIVNDGAMALASNATIPATLTIRFIGRGALKPSLGVTITYLGRIEAEPLSIFQGSGSVSFTTASVQRVFYPEWWGAIPDDSTNNYTALNNTQIAASAIEGAIIQLDRGAYRFGNDLSILPNVQWIGRGMQFGTTLKPSGAASILFRGSYRVIFKDMVIDCRLCSNIRVIDIDDDVSNNVSYLITFERVWLYKFATDVSNLVGIYATNCLDLEINHCRAEAEDTDTGNWGVELHDNVTAKVISYDGEVCNRALFVTGGAKVDVFSPYLERNVYGIYTNGSGALNIYGGQYDVPNAGSVAIGIASSAAHITIVNPAITLNGGTGVDCSGLTARLNNSRVIGVKAGDITDPNNVIEKIGGTNVSDYYTDTLFNKKTQADSSATTHYTFTMATNKMVMCDLFVWATGGGLGFAKNAVHRQFMITAPGGTAEVSTVAAVGTDLDESSSGNYNLALTISTSLSTNTCAIQITVNPSGALDDTTSSDVYSELRIRSDSLNNYIVKG